MIFPCREETHNPSTRVEGRKRTEDAELCKKELEPIQDTVTKICCRLLWVLLSALNNLSSRPLQACPPAVNLTLSQQHILTPDEK
jgi:hypothetical protein